MKKIVTWTIYILVLAAAVALVVGYSAFPIETKQVINKIMEYANTPIVIAGVSTTVGGVLIFVITRYVLLNTKFGRKELDAMRTNVDEFKKQTNEFIEGYKQKFTDLKTDYEAKFESLKAETDAKVTVLYDEFEDLQNTLLGSLEKFPNKHIQELVAQYKERFDERKGEIINKTINTNEFMDQKVAEMKAQFEEAFNELLAKVEKTLNEEAKDD